MKQCEKCGQIFVDDDTIRRNFYYTHRLDKYPDGRLNLCHSCTKENINNFNPDTFL